MSQQPSAEPNSVEKFLGGIYSESQQKFSFRDDYPGGFSKWQADARPILRNLLGLDAIAKHAAEHTPKIVTGPTKQRPGHSITKFTLETEPNVVIPFWALKPAGNGPFPLAILPHGHDRIGHDSYAGVYQNDSHREKTLAQDRDVAVQAVERGFFAIAPATRGLATEASGVPDIYKRHDNRDCRSQFMHAILAGRTAVGERVWDLSRVIDWAVKQDAVDAKQILMMGNSGGGVATMYAAACDERITIAVPSCSFSVIASQQGRIYHCDCCAIPGILKWGELYDVCGLAAPRHMLAVSGVKDGLHTAKDVNRSAKRVAAIFNAAGVGKNFEHKWGPEGHRFYKSLMWPFVERAMKVG
jgi:dienelactone hydrolase